MKAKKTLSLILSAIIIAVALPVCVSAQDSNSLEFGSDGKFKILQISDTQDDEHIAYDLPQFITTSIETADPDMIVITGDIVEDSRAGDINSDDECLKEGVLVKNDYDATLENVKAVCKAVFTPIEEAGIPFAVTQGNNDYKSKISNEDWLKIFAEYPHCITVDQSNDADGHIDQYVEINKYNSTAAGYGLWLLDNGEGTNDEQLEWFDNLETSDVPSIAFEHVPVADVGNLFEECDVWDSGALIKDFKTYRLNKDIANGTYYVIYKPGETTEQFTSWKNKGVVGAFFGHIHTDGYTGVWDGITLGLTYGCEFAKAGPYGFRTITLDEDGTFETELFTYSKGVAQPQTYEDYPTYPNMISTVFCGFFKIFVTVYKSLEALLKF